MPGTPLSTEALVLHRTDYGDADRIVWLLTPEHGRISAFAASARKSRRRFGSALEPFARLTAQVSRPTRGDLWRLHEIDVLDSHAALRASLESLVCAGAASELTAALAPEGAPSGHYVILLAYLRTLAKPPVEARDLYRFVLLSLEVAGHRPKLTSCVRCHRPGPFEQGPTHFDHTEGGLLCPTCPPRRPGARRLSSGLVAALQAFEMNGGELPADGMALLWDFTQQQIGKGLASLRMLREIGF